MLKISDQIRDELYIYIYKKTNTQKKKKFIVKRAFNTFSNKLVSLLALMLETLVL